jgi:spore coat polysaccharide biosynthesis protein SpsF
MGATRLPGKVLKEIDGKPLLQYQLERVGQVKKLDKIIVATSSLKQDDFIADFCGQHGYLCFRGSENDVLNRYYECAVMHGAKIIVRLTADCPFSDPKVIDATIQLFLDKNVDYAANTAPPESSCYPDGSDVEVFSISALERANFQASEPADREHVTFFFWKGKHGFKTAQLTRKENWSGYRFTVDYPEDYEVAKLIFNELKKRETFGHIEEIIEILNENQEIRGKNSQYYFGIGWNK